MKTILVVSIVALCTIYQCSANSYNKAVAACKKEAKITVESDEPFDYFFEKASWAPDVKYAGCFFNCVAKQLNIVDSSGVPDVNKLVQVASQHKGIPQLQLFVDPTAANACLPEAKGSSACVATENFVKCAIKTAHAHVHKS